MKKITHSSATCARLMTRTVQLLRQPRSQGLSSLPLLVIGTETLVAPGHVTTQNLGGRKICWKGWATGFFIVTVTNLLRQGESDMSLDSVVFALNQTPKKVFLPPDDILSSSRPNVIEYPPILRFWMDRWSRDQPQPGSLFQRLREAEKRDPGNEVVTQAWRVQLSN